MITRVARTRMPMMMARVRRFLIIRYSQLPGVDRDNLFLLLGRFLMTGHGVARDFDPHDRVLRNLEDQPALVIVQADDRAVEPAGGDDLIARLEGADHLVDRALLFTLRPENQEIEEHEHEA